jgi:hypothetical protein
MAGGTNDQRTIVAYWHLADNPAAPAFVRYWSKADFAAHPTDQNRGHALLGIMR